MDKKISPGTTLASMRVIEVKKCAECGIEITGIKKKRYCDESCKQKAKYKRNKQNNI